MHRIDTSTAQKDKFGAGKNGFTSGDAQLGVPATEVSPDILDAIQEEIASFIESQGINLKKSENNQLKLAIEKLFSKQASPEQPGVLRTATEQEAIAGLISGVAVAPKEMKAAMEALLDIVCPIGYPIPWYESTPPNERFLIAQPSAFDKAKFPKLAAKWPSGVIPFDLRAEYIRGLDNGRGIEAGRTVLSWRDGTVISNFLGKSAEISTPSAANIPGIHSSNYDSKANISSSFLAYAGDTLTMTGISSYIKMRVRDVAFLYVIRAQ